MTPIKSEEYSDNHNSIVNRKKRKSRTSQVTKELILPARKIDSAG